VVIILPVYGTVHTAYIHTCFNRIKRGGLGSPRAANVLIQVLDPSNIVNGTSCGFLVKFQYSGRRSSTRPPAIT
jgi:hypothetical protein